MSRIKELRKKAGLTQTQLASILCTSQANLSGWESGRWEPDAAALAKMADFFNVSIDYILGRDSVLSSADSNMATCLSDRELRLISVFRSLLPAMQESILGIVENLAAQSGGENTDKRGEA